MGVFKQFIGLLVLCVLFPTIGKGIGEIPYSQEFPGIDLPGGDWTLYTNTTGRMQLFPDDDGKINEFTPSTNTPLTSSGEARFRGNVYLATNDVFLTGIFMKLARTSSTEVALLVYESTTSNGVFNLVSSNGITASAATNYVGWNQLDVPMRAGRYYLIGGAWAGNVGYSFKSVNPYETHFGTAVDNVQLSSAWPPFGDITNSTPSGNSYLMRITTVDNGHLRMDTYGATLSTNQAVYVTDLENYTNVTLQFMHRSLSDEANAEDGVFISNDGISYTKIHDLGSAPTNWMQYTIDLTRAAASNAIALGGTARIMFSQADNLPAPSDGREFDDILIYSEPDLEQSFVTAGSQLYRGFDTDKSLIVTSRVVRHGTITNVTGVSSAVSVSLVRTGSVAHSQAYGWSPTLSAMVTATSALQVALTVPAAQKLEHTRYTLRGVADSNNGLAEGNELNNTNFAGTLSVNHYSGTLVFGDVATEAYVTNWSYQPGFGFPTFSSIEHVIAGTGIVQGFAFSFNDLKVEKDLASLDYVVDLTDTNSIYINATNQLTTKDVDYIFFNGVTLDRFGGLADVRAILPAGSGWTTNSTATMLDSEVVFFNESVNSMFEPDMTPTWNPAVNVFFCEETKPILKEVNQVEWHVSSGRFQLNYLDMHYVREDELDLLESSPLPLGDKVKKSNEGYWRWVDVTGAGLAQYHAGTGAGDARVDFTVGVSTGEFTAHFPYGTKFAWAGGGSTLEVVKDLMGPASFLDDPGSLSTEYLQTCPGDTCGGETFLGIALTSDLARVDFTLDGGLHVAGSPTAPFELTWGYIPSLLDFAQTAKTFDKANLLIAGHFVRGDQDVYTSSSDNGPAVILLTGVLSNDLQDAERPLSESYTNGFGDYAGVNFYAESDGVFTGRAVLGGVDSGDWDLTGRSKYYARKSGVSGIHEAVPGTFPADLTIYGYNMDFSNYGLNYLSSSNLESRTEGVVDLPYPAGFTQAFEELKFSCIGDLTSAELPDGDTDKNLEYWDADFTPHSIGFERNVGCDPTGTITFAITTYADHIADPLFGIIGIEPTGDLVAESYGLNPTGDDPIDSRFNLPNSLDVNGPAAEVYTFMPNSQAYLNDYSLAGALNSAGDGFFSFAGTLDMPFFEDAYVQFFTDPGTDTNSIRYMMGGWPDAGWTEDTHDFFDQVNFDTNNRAWPDDGTITSIADYRDQVNEDYVVRVKQTWLGIVDFNYPLRWNDDTKAFESYKAVETDILVLQMEHLVDYISAENAEITFGLTYGGLPSINLANMVINAVNEATGIASAFINGVTEELVGTLEKGLDDMDRMLNASAEDLFEPIFDAVIEPVVCDLYVTLSNNYAAGTDYFSGSVSQYIMGISAPPGITNIQDVISNIATGFNQTASLIGEVTNSLDSVLRALDSVTTSVTIDPETGATLGAPINGLLWQDAGDAYPVLSSLTEALIGALATEIFNALDDALGDEITIAFEELEPTLETLQDTLLQVRAYLTNVQHLASSGEELANELGSVISPAAVSNITASAANAVNEQFSEYEQAFNPFNEYSKEEIIAAIRSEVEEAFHTSELSSDITTVLRSWLYDLDARLSSAVDSVFAQVNEAIRDIASEYLSEIDDSVNGFLDDLEEIMGAGQIDGYAHINGDSLERARVDLFLQWKVPDDFEFKGYLEIEALDSDGTEGGCTDGADSATEVKIGAEDISVAWIGDGLGFDVYTKFTFANGGLAGMGGGIEMTRGQIDFEAFQISELGAAVAFGLYENYLAAELRCLFSSFEVAGGLFFGRTCTLDPIEMIDPEVAAVIGDPPFSGAYVYGEGWMPIVDYGCVFNVAAGVGAGFFYFVEGPTYGAKMFLGAKGEALCVVSVRGEVSMVGVKSGDSLSASGKGKISGKAGACPFCVKFSKTVTVKYTDGSWDVDY